MINLSTCDHLVISSLTKQKTNLSYSYQLFAAIDIMLTFRFFNSFEMKNVKYELLEVYSERVIERSLKSLLDHGLVQKVDSSYQVSRYEHHH